MAPPLAADTTVHLQSQNLLLRLPAELRNRIYELALAEGQLLEVTYYSAMAVQPALARTCRAVRHETLSMFYDLNDFWCYTKVDVGFPGSNAEVLCRWLRAIGKANRKHMRRIFVLEASGRWKQFPVDPQHPQLQQYPEAQLLAELTSSGTRRIRGVPYYIVRVDGLEIDE